MSKKMFSGVRVNDLDRVITEIMKEQGRVVFKATEEGLEAGEKELIKVLKAATPTDTGEFKRNWKGTGKKYRLARYIGNSTTVKGADGEVSLANIFQYSATRGNKFISKTFEANSRNIAEIIIGKIEKGV